MKRLYKTIIILIFSFGVFSLFYLALLKEEIDKYNKNKESVESACMKYYLATETMLDSLVDCNDNIFETDAGVDYLNAKEKLENILF